MPKNYIKDYLLFLDYTTSKNLTLTFEIINPI